MIKFLTTCGEDNLQFLLHPPRLQKALEVLDGDKSGEIDVDEWELARRPRFKPNFARRELGRRIATRQSRGVAATWRPRTFAGNSRP